MENTPRIPRAEWAAHPRFPDQTLLLRSHESFRLASRQVTGLADEAPERAHRLFRRWMYAMRNHEAYEEGKLYRFLTARWGVSMDALVAGHEELGRKKAAVFDAFAAALEREAAPDDRRRLRRALASFDEALRAHLELEEDTVIPLLLELTPKEFAQYYFG